MHRLLLTALALLLLAPALSAQNRAGLSPYATAAPVGLATPALALDLDQPQYRTVQATFTVTSDADAGPGTLRQALLDANATDGLDEIVFAIDGGGSYQEIFLQTALPFVMQPVTMDGATQGCDTGAGPCVRLDGAAIPDDPETLLSGLALLGGASTVRGLLFTRFLAGEGVPAVILASSDNVVAGCYFGTDRTGSVTDPDGTPGSGDELGNGFGIIVRSLVEGVSASGNVIGGDTEADRNVMGGSTFSGIVMQEGATRTRVEGNVVGASADATVALPNGESGVLLSTRSTRSTVEGNVLSGNVGSGIRFQGQTTENLITGNLIGTNGAGTAALPNGTLAGLAVPDGFGISIIDGTDSVITDNLISGNLFAGIVLGTPLPDLTVSGIEVSGNLIGTDLTGTQPIPNGVPGVEDIGFGVVMFSSEPSTVVTGNVIGGDSMEDANVIGFNTTAGIGAEGNVFGNTIDHNYIGLTPDFDAVPNGVLGILLRNGARQNVIGSDALSDDPGNAIAFQPVGIGVGQGSAGNAIRYNRFAGPTNEFLPVDLDLDGPTADDTGDADDGPNRLQNTPVIDGAELRGDFLTVGFRVDSAPANAAYPLVASFYARSDMAGGLTTFEPLGQRTVAEADAQVATSATFDVSDFGIETGDTPLVVAIATDAAGNSSEMALQGRVVAGDADAAASVDLRVAPNPTRGAAQFTFSLAEAGEVSLVVFDALGRAVATLADGPHAAGAHAARLDAALASGVYVWRLAVGERAETGTFTVVR